MLHFFQNQPPNYINIVTDILMNLSLTYDNIIIWYKCHNYIITNKRYIHMNNSKETNYGLWTIRILYVINLLIFLPLFFPRASIFFNYLFYLRIFYIPYISTVVLSIIYHHMLKKYECSGLEFFFFYLVLLLTIICLWLLNLVYHAAMGI